MPIAITFDRDPHFTLRFWKILQEAFGLKLQFSTTYHPQTYSQSKRVIQVLEDMLRGYVLEFPGSWECYLPLGEFAYNNSYHAIGPELVRKTKDKVKMIYERLKYTSDRKKFYVYRLIYSLRYHHGRKF
ncbi:Retrotransposable element Tf2 [Gossypium australe]|uniref:Retrotransposable element Tf2 n=1 Tax=Gossypium australe TaxID=47621 RepID=A0A5B6WSM5_9ROSI|nr:Retrotransposable element Tf2 [Gossypium australe]